MGILVQFSMVLLYSAGTGSLVSSPVLCMAVQLGGRCNDLCCLKNKTVFLKLCHTIKLDELYGELVPGTAVLKSFQGWSFYFYAHKLLQRPPFCFAQAYSCTVCTGLYAFTVDVIASSRSFQRGPSQAAQQHGRRAHAGRAALRGADGPRRRLRHRLDPRRVPGVRLHRHAGLHPVRENVRVRQRRR